MAGFGLYRAYREQTRPHGLLYAAVVLQLFYTLILLVLVTVVFRTTPISTQGPKPTTGSAIVAEHFLLAVQSSDIDGAKALTDSAMFDQSEGNLKGLNDSIQFTPQLVSEQSIPVTNLKQTAVNVKYPNGAAALSLWRTGQTSSGQRFVAIVVVESAPEDWRIVMAQVLEATSSGVALQAAEQLTLLEPVVQ